MPCVEECDYHFYWWLLSITRSHTARMAPSLQLLEQCKLGLGEVKTKHAVERRTFDSLVAFFGFKAKSGSATSEFFQIWAKFLRDFGEASVLSFLMGGHSIVLFTPKTADAMSMVNNFPGLV